MGYEEDLFSEYYSGGNPLNLNTTKIEGGQYLDSETMVGKYLDSETITVKDQQDRGAPVKKTFTRVKPHLWKSTSDKYPELLLFEMSAELDPTKHDYQNGEWFLYGAVHQSACLPSTDEVAETLAQRANMAQEKLVGAQEDLAGAQKSLRRAVRRT